MKLLNPNQIEQIRKDILSVNLSIHSLQEELIDHVCCTIEENMNHGKSFEEAYQIIKVHIGSQHLKEIEEDTLLLTNKLYHLMKNLLKFSGTISLSCIAIGTLMRFMYLPGADLILVVGFLLLTFLFIPIAVFLDYSLTAEKQWIRRITLLFGCLFLSNGILFKVMHWQGANMLIVGGFFFMLFLFAPVVISNEFKKESSNRAKSIIGLGGISLLIFAMGILFKLMHWPGAVVFFVTGSLLFFGIFIPLYCWFILQKKEISFAPFIYVIILSVYVITMTGLISISPQTNPTTQNQTSPITHSPN